METFLQVRQFVAAFIALKGLGAILFVFGHGFGAFLLVRFPFLLGDFFFTFELEWKLLC